MKKAWKPTLPPFRKFKRDVYLKHSKTAGFIYQLGEGAVIRTKSQEIPVAAIAAPETKEKIAYLKKCLLRYRAITGMGRGIAAIQVGIPQRFAVIYMLDTKDIMTIINPVITKKSHSLLRFPEGCMSEGPLFAPVTRPSWIEFSYYDEQGQKQYWNTKDENQRDKITNRVFQHEIDHMDGVIFLDRADLRNLTLESDPAYYDKAAFEEVE